MEHIGIRSFPTKPHEKNIIKSVVYKEKVSEPEHPCFDINA